MDQGSKGGQVARSEPCAQGLGISSLTVLRTACGIPMPPLYEQSVSALLR